MKRKLYFAFIFITFILLFGCAKSPRYSPVTVTPRAPYPSELSSKSLGERDILIRLAHNQETERGYGIGVSHLFGILSELDGTPAIDLRILDNGVMGDENEVLDMTRTGKIEMNIVSLGVLSALDSNLSVFNLPFLFGDHKQVERAVSSPACDEIIKKFNQGSELFALDIYACGLRQIATTEKKINSFKDLRGLSIRIPNSDMYYEVFLALGALPVATGWSVVPDMLRNGEVDAMENSFSVLRQSGLYQHLSYIAVTNHIWEGGMVVINRPFYDKLSDDLRAELQSAVRKSAIYQRHEISRIETGAMSILRSNGLLCGEIDERELRLQTRTICADFILEHEGAASLTSLAGFISD